MGHARKVVTAGAALALAGALLPGLAPTASASDHGDTLTRAPSLQPGSSHGRPLPAPTRVIVKYKGSVSPAAQLHALDAKGLQVRKNLGLINARVVAVPRGQTAAAVAAQLRKDPAVEYAEPDMLRVPLATAPAPNDPYFRYSGACGTRDRLSPTERPQRSRASTSTPWGPGAWRVGRRV